MRSIVAVAVLLVFAALPAGALADDPPDSLAEDSPSAAQQAKVDLLADFVAGDDAVEADVTAARESVSALRDESIGWGAIFKLEKLAAVMGVAASDLVALGGDSGEFDFGELKKALTPEQLAEYRSGVKNFGQLNKASKAVGADKAERMAERMADKAESKAARKAQKAARKAEKSRGGAQ